MTDDEREALIASYEGWDFVEVALNPHGASRVIADLANRLDRALRRSEVRAGVVAEEPEWEYGVRLHPRGRVDSGTNTALYVPPTTPHITMERAVEMAQLNPRYRPTFHRRRKAGPWVPVKHDD